MSGAGEYPMRRSRVAPDRPAPSIVARLWSWIRYWADYEYARTAIALNEMVTYMRPHVYD